MRSTTNLDLLRCWCRTRCASGPAACAAAAAGSPGRRHRCEPPRCGRCPHAMPRSAAAAGGAAAAPRPPLRLLTLPRPPPRLPSSMQSSPQTSSNRWCNRCYQDACWHLPESDDLHRAADELHGGNTHQLCQQPSIHAHLYGYGLMLALAAQVWPPSVAPSLSVLLAPTPLRTSAALPSRCTDPGALGADACCAWPDQAITSPHHHPSPLPRVPC